MVKSCYIHIPFCKKICSYCDFCKIYYDSKFVKKYFKELKKEIEKDYEGEELDTLYIGGGTPTCLSLEELKDFFQILSLLKLSCNVEFTIEANIDTLTKEKLDFLYEQGVNRLSIGIETIHPKHLRFLERDFDKERFNQLITYARGIGFSNFNFDLIYALPGESIKDLEKDLDFILSYHPEHISTYSLMIEEHTKLGIQKVENIDDELDYQMYQFICHKLKENHYLHYEISNFAKEGYSSQHNLCYWKNQEYYGFGLGASSYLHEKRSMNTRSITSYSFHNKIQEDMISDEEKINYEVLLGLRLLKGIDLKEFEKKYRKTFFDYFEVDSLIQQKLLVVEDNCLRIPENLLYVSNEILVKILQKRKVL